MKENDIRPTTMFNEYLRLAARDATLYFGPTDRVAVPCPACEAIGAPAFTKHGFVYELCDQCETLYVSPRPAAAAFSQYYTESASVEYWATTFYRETAEARRVKLWKPKAQSVAALLAETPVEWTVVDVGGGYGLFAEEMRAATGRDPVVIEPGPSLARVCRERGLPVVQKFLEAVELGDLPAGAKAFTSFELFEHLHDPAVFLSRLLALMSPGDLFIFTTLSGGGVDIQVLWEHSKSVMPPHHLNFLNPASLTILLRRVGFEVIRVTTPGALDIDILANNVEHVSDRFWKSFLRTASDEERQTWQRLISASGRSSHMMAVARKPTGAGSHV